MDKLHFNRDQTQSASGVPTCPIYIIDNSKKRPQEIDIPLAQQLSFQCPNSHIKIIAWMQIHNSRELTTSLNLPSTTSEVELLCAAYKTWKEECVSRLIGDFSFALYDPAENSVLIARDPNGTRPLYYRVDSHSLHVSFDANSLIDVNGNIAERDLEWAARYLLNISFSHTSTGYKNILKLPPGHIGKITTSECRIHRYFYWRDDAPVAKKRDPKWVEAYLEKLKEAVACRLGEGNVACENSGGLDSAAITGLAAQLHNKSQLHTMGFAVLKDESSHIMATSQLHRIQQNHLFTNYQVVSDALIDRHLDALGYPEEHGNASGHVPAYEMCESLSIRTLLSGFGGDEAVTYQAHQLRYELMDQRNWGELHAILPGNLLTKALRAVKQVATKNPPNYDKRFRAALQQRWDYQGIQTSIVQDLQLNSVFSSQDTHDTPYRRINDAIIQYKLGAAYIPTRLENCSIIAAVYGIEYSWPLLDQRLIQQYLSTPSIEKYGPNGMGRFLHRRAMEGIAPAKVQWKPGKDMGITSYNVNQQRPENLRNLVQLLHDQLDHVSSTLATIVDVKKLRQVALELPSLKGNELQAAMSMIKNTTTKLHWLNRWFARPA